MGASPIHSSINIFPTALVISPFSIICGVIVKGSNRYVPSNYVGWALTMIGFGLLTLLKADASTAQWVGFQVITAAGVGIIWAGTVFPVLAPLPVTSNAPAVALLIYLRTFSQVCLDLSGNPPRFSNIYCGLRRRSGV